jgi:hypothetical protein
LIKLSINRYPEVMKLTDDHKIKIFCAALSGTIQADAYATVASGPNTGSKVGAPSLVEKASATASEAIAKLQSKAWE